MAVPPLAPSDPLERVFGALELRVLEALWARADAATVRDLEPAFAGIAYTTLMTTLDRLHRKGVLLREKAGRALRLPAAAVARRSCCRASPATRWRRFSAPAPLNCVRWSRSSWTPSATKTRDVLDALDALIRERGRTEGER